MNWINEFKSIDFIFTVTSCMVAIGTIVSTLEWVYIRDSFGDNGLFSWYPRKSRRKVFLIFDKTFSNLYNKRGFVITQIIKLLLSFSIFPLIYFDVSIAFIFLALFVIDFMESYRGAESTTGADQLLKMMHLICFIHFASNSEIISSACIIFIFSMLALAYSTSGWIRITQKKWRNGEDLLLVLRQETYGEERAWIFAKDHKQLTSIISLSILVFEILVIATPFLPIPWLIAYLSIGILFHVVNALVMGLNIFVWTFPATYPAVIWVALTLQSI